MDSSSIPAGSTIAHYRIIKSLGSGGMGKVYLAEDTSLERPVALKILPPEFVRDKDRMRRFEHEAKAASSVTHPNASHIYEIGESNGIHFIAMEYIEGQTLAARLNSGPIPEREGIHIVEEIAGVLEAAHAKGIVHRDLKPANIMLTPSGQIKLLDFGLAKTIGNYKTEGGSELQTASQTELGIAIGTLPYMSPEQVLGDRIDHRTDFFSLGCVLYEMLTQCRPFTGNSNVEIADKILNREPSFQFPEKTPAATESILKKLLAKNREDRYSSASDLLADLRRLQLQPSVRKSASSKIWIGLSLALLIVAVAAAAIWYRRNQNIRWAKEQALPEISRLTNQQKFEEAYVLARKAEQFIPNDPEFKDQWKTFSEPLIIHSDPAGADVYREPYAADEKSAWQYIGKTPIEKEVLPLGWYRYKFDKPGFEQAVLFAPNSFNPVARSISVSLQKKGSSPDGMVRIAGTAYTPDIFNVPYKKSVALSDYWMDKFEVTNKAFKAFVNQGGYSNKKYWKIPFLRNGQQIPWEEAMNLFRDKTGRPGPSTWELGDYPEGRGDYPVTGVSWYEAAAYADFAGKQLPSLFQWNYAAGVRAAATIIPHSNFSNAGLHATGNLNAMNPFGTYDMAGNAKEWVWNETEPGLRYTDGGAWGEVAYLFYEPMVRPAFDRSEKNGFRCIKMVSNSDTDAALLAPLKGKGRDLGKEKPVSDDVFEIYRSMYAYDPAPLNSKIEKKDDSNKYWTKEKVSFDAAYGKERMATYLYIPKNAKPPFQTVVFFPPSPASYTTSSEFLEQERWSWGWTFVIKSGRVLVFPIYKESFERGGSPENVTETLTPRQSREYMIQGYQDLARTIDYLATRKEFDLNKLAYYGNSWGANRGTIYLALEKRAKLGILAFTQLGDTELPEMNQVNFLPRIRQPVLMINGRYDSTTPIETAQKPMFHLLGTAEKDKRHLIFDGGHTVPPNELARAVLDWLDHYFGPVAITNN